MPSTSQDLTRARREEILNACAALYQTQSFKEITLKEIGAHTSFTRTSIYNYFHTKEEIFLALLQREYQAWIDDLQAMPPAATADAFADALAHTLEKRALMLKLEAMNLFDIEDNTRMERLVDFKRVYARSLQVLGRCVAGSFPALTDRQVQEFLYALYPFLLGVYPYTTATPNQRQAMAQAGVQPPDLTIYAIVRAFAARQLRGFGL